MIANNELVDAGDGVGSDLGVGVAEEGEELGDEDIQGPVQVVRVKNLRGVFANFL